MNEKRSVIGRSPSPIGIVAGSGRYPTYLLRESRIRGHEVAVVAFDHVTLPASAAEADCRIWLPVGQLRRAARFFLDAGVERAIMAGGVPWNPLLVKPMPDLDAIRALPRGFAGDDTLLREVANIFERKGVRIVDPGELVEGLLARSGHLAGPDLDPQSPTVRKAVAAARALGRQDGGQSAIATAEDVLFENRRGTDQLLERARRLECVNGVLAKMCKPDQDTRFDLPTLGPRTVALAARAKLSGIICQAGHTLILDLDETTALANHHGISLMAC